MKPFKTKFQRVETKFMVNEATYQLLLNQLKPYMKPNEYAHSTIANLYYDTPSYQMIRWSIEKPDYKEKIRIRSYEGVPSEESQVFIEVKKKFQKIVYKRRIQEQLAATQAFFAGQDSVLEDSQVKNELCYMKKQYGKLQPMMYIYYDRYSLQGREDESVRITFDSNGSLEINGGEVYVQGSQMGGNGAIDADIQPVINGGTVIAIGTADMAQGFVSGDTQASISATVNGNVGSVINIKDESGDVVASLTADKAFQSVIASVEGMIEGSTYTVEVDGVAVSTQASSSTGGGMGGPGGFPGGSQQPPAGFGNR